MYKTTHTYTLSYTHMHTSDVTSICSRSHLWSSHHHICCWASKETRSRSLLVSRSRRRSRSILIPFLSPLLEFGQHSSRRILRLNDMISRCTVVFSTSNASSLLVSVYLASKKKLHECLVHRFENPDHSNVKLVSLDNINPIIKYLCIINRNSTVLIISSINWFLCDRTMCKIMFLWSSSF